ncbi:MAG: CPBP family intramembrane metalloprotease [Gudongella sp.]|nr:CPBP family intramembrane metalloprotease [Gudongella sp.]
MRARSLPTINEVNILFLVLGLVLLIFGSMVQQRDLYIGILITEYILILVPNLVYLKARGYSLRKALGLHPITVRQIIQIFFIMIFAYPMAVFLNYIVLIMVNSVSPAMPIGVPVPTSLTDYLIGLLVIAVTPGICEEVMFRGTMQSAYTRMGDKQAILISALLFGMFHFNLLNLLGPLFLGIVLGIIRYKTNSLYGSILGHTINNGIALTLGFLLTGFTENIQEITEQAPLVPEGLQLIITLVMLGSWALFSFVLLYLLLRNLPDVKDKTAIDNFLDTEESNKELGDLEMESYKISWAPIIVIAGIFVFLNYRYFFLI